MATVMTRPTIGSARGQPSAAPAAPISTASEVKPSVRACSPSATSAAEPIDRPTRIRYRATHSLPMNPITAATATQGRWVTVTGCSSRSIAAAAASAADNAIRVTMAIPARSSARPKP